MGTKTLLMSGMVSPAQYGPVAHVMERSIPQVSNDKKGVPAALLKKEFELVEIEVAHAGISMLSYRVHTNDRK